MYPSHVTAENLELYLTFNIVSTNPRRKQKRVRSACSDQDNTFQCKKGKFVGEQPAEMSFTEYSSTGQEP